MNLLALIHADIDARVRAIRSQHPEWLCAKGCGNCCRQLAEVPQLTLTEWRLLQEGLATLPKEQLEEIRQNLQVLAGQSTRPVVCPLLDQKTDACPIYAWRPVACRTYGFYVQRDLGLYCREIESQVAEGTLSDVVWGNHDVIDRELAGQGESRALTAWFGY